jgi:cell wall-associated NlpC family hydrolase
MDGVMQIQSRIAAIQARFTTPLAEPSRAGAAWASAASSAGLEGTTAAGATGGAMGGAMGGAKPGRSEAGVVADAQKYLGVPYRWGGTDPASGLDCSGLTQRVYRDVGIELPRTASQQATAGRPVPSLAEARPGDLLFFDYSSDTPGIDHVGIYVGNGQMIAAPQEGESVKVQSAGKPTLIRRILPEAAGAPVGRTAGVAAGFAAAPAGGTRLAGVPYADLFTRAGNQYGVAPSLLAAVASQESGFNSRAVSPAGAQGLMQFMPATATGLGVNPLDPASAVNGAARYLSTLKAQFGSDELALAAYNAGPGAVRQYGGIPPYPETQNYVRAVTTKAEAFR